MSAVPLIICLFRFLTAARTDALNFAFIMVLFDGEFIMSKSMSTILCFIILSSVITAQDVIENPEKPLNKNANRVVELVESMRIDDVGGDFYFKYPRNPKISPDGSLFIQDHEQLLQFDQSGYLVRNYFKKGQGPGEMQEVGDYFFADEALIVHDRRLQKILWFDFEGKLIEELRIHELPVFARLHLFRQGTYYFFGHRIPSTEGKPEVIEVPYDLIAVSEGGEKIEPVISFPVESFAISTGRSGAMASIAELVAAPFKEDLAVCHTQQYLLKILDLESGKIIRSFRRKYKRVKVPKDRRVGGSIGISGKTYTAPREYFNDISRLFSREDLLWVVTSTVEKEKGVMVDVFNFEGEYVDNFYLKIPGEDDPIAIGYRPMTISNGFFFTTTRNEDETYSIIKYRIEDKGYEKKPAALERREL